MVASIKRRWLSDGVMIEISGWRPKAQSTSDNRPSRYPGTA